MRYMAMRDPERVEYTPPPQSRSPPRQSSGRQITNIVSPFTQPTSRPTLERRNISDLFIT